MKTFIISLLKHTKSLNNLLFNLSINSVSSFSYIKLVIKYYSYFKYILQYFKGNRFYNLFKALFKLIGLINVLLGIFVLVVFTEFRYDEYKTFIEYYITNFSFSNFFMKSKQLIKNCLKYISSLFDDDLEKPNSPSEDKVNNKSPNNYNIDKKNTFNIDNNTINSDSISNKYLPYYCLITFITVVVCFKYPEYTITPIVSGITAFVTSLFGNSDTPGDKPSDDTVTLQEPLINKGKEKMLDKLDTEHLSPCLQPKVDLNPTPSSSHSAYSPARLYTYIKKIGFISSNPADVLIDNQLAQDAWGNQSPTDSDSSSKTVTQAYRDPFVDQFDKYFTDTTKSDNATTSPTTSEQK